MNESVTCPWESTSWEESTYFQAPMGPSLIQADIHRIFTGDSLKGESHATLLCCRPQEGSAGYVATEYVRGRIGDRSGTFVLQHMAAMGGEKPEGMGVVVPDSGTGDFTGMRGSCSFGHVDGKSVLQITFSIS